MFVILFLKLARLAGLDDPVDKERLLYTMKYSTWTNLHQALCQKD